MGTLGGCVMKYWRTTTHCFSETESTKVQASLSLPILPENSIDSRSPILVLPDHDPGRATYRTP